MKTTTKKQLPSASLDFCLHLAKVQAEVARRMDDALGCAHGIGFGDFQLLVCLNNAPEGLLRRVDLAERLGHTASGVTRTLLPLEKIGLVDRQPDPRDARVGHAAISRAGESLLSNAMTTAQSVATEFLGDVDIDVIESALGRIAG